MKNRHLTLLLKVSIICLWFENKAENFSLFWPVLCVGFGGRVHASLCPTSVVVIKSRLTNYCPIAGRWQIWILRSGQNSGVGEELLSVRCFPYLYMGRKIKDCWGQNASLSYFLLIVKFTWNLKKSGWVEHWFACTLNSLEFSKEVHYSYHLKTVLAIYQKKKKNCIGSLTWFLGTFVRTYIFWITQCCMWVIIWAEYCLPLLVFLVHLSLYQLKRFCEIETLGRWKRRKNRKKEKRCQR